MPGEPLLWYRRFERFRLMEPVRSIPHVYREELQNTEQRRKTQKAHPNDPDSTWYAMARLWHWEAAMDIFSSLVFLTVFLQHSHLVPRRSSESYSSQ